MNIIGIGVDIVSIARIRSTHARHGQAFEKKVLGEAERAELKDVSNAHAFIAKRFAAKEAVGKALGTGLSSGLRFCDILVLHDARGKPVLAFEGEAQRLMNEAGVRGSFVSISDEKEYAVAQVILVGDDVSLSA